MVGGPRQSCPCSLTASNKHDAYSSINFIHSHRVFILPMLRDVVHPIRSVSLLRKSLTHFLSTVLEVVTILLQDMFRYHPA
jgi:hypothetical protein